MAAEAWAPGHSTSTVKEEMDAAVRVTLVMLTFRGTPVMLTFRRTPVMLTFRVSLLTSVKLT